MRKKKRKKRRSFKLSVAAFIAALVFVAIGLLEELTVGGSTLKIRSVSPEIILFLLGATLGNYAFRGYTKAKYYRKELDDDTEK